jgi:hypothetical protein
MKPKRRRLSAKCHIAFVVITGVVITGASFAECTCHGRWVSGTAHLVVPLGIAAMGVYFALNMSRLKEFERENFLLAAAAGFFAAMAAAIVLGGLSDLHVIVRISPWWIYDAGIVMWLATWFFLIWRRT